MGKIERVFGRQAAPDQIQVVAFLDTEDPEDIDSVLGAWRTWATVWATAMLKVIEGAGWVVLEAS